MKIFPMKISYNENFPIYSSLGPLIVISSQTFTSSYSEDHNFVN